MSLYVQKSCESKTYWPSNYKKTREILWMVLRTLEDLPDDIKHLMLRTFNLDYYNEKDNVRSAIVAGLYNVFQGWGTPI
jgi:hypothetical protein